MSVSPFPLLATPEGVARCLTTYTDWWQPPTGSMLQVGSARRGSGNGYGFRAGVLDTLDDRTELCRRIAELTEGDRRLLVLWYVQQAPTEEIARQIGLSRRQCFRRRARAMRRLVELGEPELAQAG